MKRSVFLSVLSLIAVLSMWLNFPEIDTMLQMWQSLSFQNQQVSYVMFIFCVLMYVLLALNEISVMDNGYVKKYSFKNFVLIVSLLINSAFKVDVSMLEKTKQMQIPQFELFTSNLATATNLISAQTTMIAALAGILISAVLLILRNREFRVDDIVYRVANPIISASIMCYLYVVLGGTSFPIVEFRNFAVIFIMSLVVYIVDTTITILASFIKGKSKKSFVKAFFQEYGWIYKYEVWQVIYAILFYNCAAVLLYRNFQFKPFINDTSMTSLMLLVNMGEADPSNPAAMQSTGDAIAAIKAYYATTMPQRLFDFVSWQLSIIAILYIPLHGWLSSFRTFISFNKENVSNAISHMKEGIVLLDAEGVVVNANQAASQMIQTDSKLTIGEKFSERLMLLKDSALSGEEKIKELVGSFSKQEKAHETEIVLQNERDGVMETNYLNILVTPEVNRFSEVTGTVVTIENVTIYRKLIQEINEKNVKLEEYRLELEKRLKELQETQEQLIISEKMAVIGQLVSGVAHEINTPLASIKSNLDLEKMMIDMTDSSNPASVDKYKAMFVNLFEVNNEAMLRIMDIVKGLKNFARLDEAELKVVNIHEGLESTLMLVRNQNVAKIEVLKEFGDIPFIKCYPQQLNQVFLNVIINGMQAIKVEGKITIRTGFVNQDRIFISITDTGEGIKEEHLPKIFDPGFTTKGVGVGTGLGLSISYKIMSKHNGEIKVSSKVGEGTTMTIEMPIDLEKTAHELSPPSDEDFVDAEQVHINEAVLDIEQQENTTEVHV